MKKTLNIIASAVIALAAITSCAKEQLIENVLPAGEAIQVSINGQIGELTPADATKATAGSVVRVTWETGDEVYVYDGTACIGTLTVTPDEKNTSYALLSGEIKASAASPSKLTLVYVKGAESAPDIAEGKISIPLSTQDQTEVPFVLYTTVDYDAAKLAKENEYISFSFATSVMTVNCTGLQTGAEDDVTKAEIDGVSTICELSVTGDGVTVAGTTPGKITRTAGFQQSDQRASFSVALAKTADSEVDRTIKVTKGDRQFTASYPKQAFDISKSFNSVFALAAVPYCPIPFTITSSGNTTVAITKEGSPNTISLEYRTASAGWTTYTVDKIIKLDDGEFVQFRAGEDGNEGFSKEDENFYYVSVEGDGEVSASGNIMSLLDSSLEETSLGDYVFYGLFSYCESLTDASNLVLPATTLANYCYIAMFLGCTGLTSAPALPATTLAEGCYYLMFAYSGLTTSPTLPATTLADYCYSNMFEECASLTAAPALPATTLAEGCYNSMFEGCTSLTAAPALPATTLTEDCYNSMFRGCTSLTDVPDFPAATLAEDCYCCMFYGCDNLTSAPALPATTLADYCYYEMFAYSGLTAAPALPAATLADYCYCEMFYYCDNLTSAPALPATTLASSCYSDMFYGCDNLTSAPALPATTLASSCYSYMFKGCTSLTSAPALPATTLASSCYSNMFNGCAKLSSAPALPATTLASYCYSCMFDGCAELSSAPELPATTLANSCYYQMFHNCDNLTAAPALPATTLANSCYSYMFYDCDNLTATPDLPATELVDGCYSRMFYDCHNLSYVKALFLTTPGTNYTDDWLHGVASSGIFVKNASATWDVRGFDGIPADWTVETESPS